MLQVIAFFRLTFQIFTQFVIPSYRNNIYIQFFFVVVLLCLKSSDGKSASALQKSLCGVVGEVGCPVPLLHFPSWRWFCSFHSGPQCLILNSHPKVNSGSSSCEYSSHAKSSPLMCFKTGSRTLLALTKALKRVENLDCVISAQRLAKGSSNAWWVTVHHWERSRPVLASVLLHQHVFLKRNLTRMAYSSFFVWPTSS